MLFLIGVFSGIITAIGMGGGTVLVLLLTIVLIIPQQVAQSANLIFFIPTAITAIILNVKEKNIDLKVGFSIIFFGIIGACFGSFLANRIDVKSLRKYFGAFLICIAIYEIYNYYKLYIKSKNTNNKIG